MYARVLAAAVLCYAALGAVLRILPDRLEALGAGSVAVGLAVGAPALTGVVFRPLGGRLADDRGPAAILGAGAVIMAAGVVPAFVADAAVQVVSRLLTGAGEGLMMSAGVLWLLRLGGAGRQGRALGHIGLANYGGLALGPLLADALRGSQDAGRVTLAAIALPLLGAALTKGISAPIHDGHERRAAPGLARAVARPGAGLLLVNVGYVALLSFGTSAAREHRVAAASLVVPVFALTVIAVRVLGGSVPDRVGPQRTLLVTGPLAAAGLAGVAAAHGTALVLAAVAVLAAGQALAVPALGLLALAHVPAARHGAAAGLFFACFDAGVGLGGPLSGALARLGGPPGALAGAAIAVACAAPLVLVRRGIQPLRPLVD
jgi:MFS family permease